MKKIHLILSGLIFCLVYSCSTKTSENTLEDTAPELVIHGVYEGVLPCADCEGIEYHIQLDSDFTYKSFNRYMGRTNRIELENGNWEWFDDTVIIVHNAKQDTKYFSVHAKAIRMLDREGRWFGTEHEEKYTLNLLPGVTDVTELPIAVQHSRVYENMYLTGFDAVAFSEGKTWQLNINFEKEIAFKDKSNKTTYYQITNVMFGKEAIIMTGNVPEPFTASLIPMQCKRISSHETFNYQLDASFGKTNYSGCAKMLYNEDLIATWKLKKLYQKLVDQSNCPKGLPTFVVSQDKISGNTSCNNYFASILLYNNIIRLQTPIVTTKMMCEKMEVENVYLEMLNKVKTYEIKSNALTLYDADKNELALFTK
jgi:heat shock protein HslJ/uncharacterized lipoprotein NlpE involved in copper resistance